MKARALLLLSTIFISLNIAGQSYQDMEMSKNNEHFYSCMELPYSLIENEEQLTQFEWLLFNERDVNDLWRIDSSISYYFVVGMDSASVAKNIFTYDDLTNTINYITIRRPNQGYEWKNTDRSLLTFNDKNQQIQTIKFDWVDDKWVNVQKTDYAYNENNIQNKYIRYDWIEEKWVGNRKTERDYNDEGDEILQTSYNWDVDNEKWLNATKVEFDFNDQGLLYRTILYTTNMETNEWKPLEKDTTSFNSGGLEIIRLTYRWDDNLYQWYNYERTSFTYNDDIRSNNYDYWDLGEWKHWSKNEGFRIDSMKVGYNGYNYIDDSIWFHNRKSEIINDEFGHIIFQETYRIPTDYTEWLGTIKYEKAYNEIGQLVEDVDYNWDYWNEEWVPNEKKQRKYNNVDINHYRSTYLWDEDSWNKYTSSISYYSNISSIRESNLSYIQIQVHPNPCATKITLEFENLNNISVVYKIYSLTGSIVKEGILKSNNTINVSTLGKGYYMIELEVGNKSYSGKFLKL